MKTKICHLFLMLFTFLFLCCNSNSPIIQVNDVREVDFLNKTGEVIEGTFVREIMGGQQIMLCDTLLLVFTSNPDGMLEVYSINNLNKKLGSICKQGRAQNEMARITPCQTYIKDNHCFLYVVDGGVRICEIDITESLEKSSTVVTRTKMRHTAQLGYSVFLNNDIDYSLDFMQHYSNVDNDKNHVYSKYTLIKGDEQTELDFFKRPMAVTDDGFRDFPYRGTIHKHPSKNIVVNKFNYMDYLLFMDFDKKHNFVVHQNGSMTHEGLFEPVEPWIQNFSPCTVTENYIFVYYRNGDYSHIQRPGDDFYPELLIFDWDGNYIKGLKMDRNSISPAYNENSKILYTFCNRTEQLYEYDLSGLLP